MRLRGASDTPRITPRARRYLAPALVVSALLHAAAAVPMLWPHERGGGDNVLQIELVDLGDPAPHATAVALDAGPPPPAAATAPVDEVAALVAERDDLAARLESATRERTQLGDEIAALRSETRALAGELAEERRRAERREQEHAERLAEDRAMHEQLVAALRREIAEKDIELTRSRDGLALSIVDHVLFPSGRASLTPDGRAVIDTVARILASGPERAIVVEGHTDNVPIGPELAERFPSNWELSTARATEVVRQLVTRGVPPRALEAVGRADTQPAASNATDAGRRRNRRIEIVLRNVESDTVTTWEGQP